MVALSREITSRGKSGKSFFILVTLKDDFWNISVYVLHMK